MRHDVRHCDQMADGITVWRQWRIGVVMVFTARLTVRRQADSLASILCRLYALRLKGVS